MTCPPEKSLSFTDALSKSYKLSYPVLAGDAGKALCVVIESMDEWKVDLTVQKRRKYYKPFSQKLRKKIILSKPVLLQYIVCRRTVKHEKSQETELLNGLGTLDERTLLLRFIKHILQESFCQAFYVTIGICRVLHKYDHATTKLIYGVLDQRDQEMLVDDPNNKTDYEYRRWKMVLFDKLEQRFEKFVEVRSGPRNEKRFVSHEPPAEVSDYVKKCLNLLTPWETEHILPEEFEPTKFNIAGLRLDGRYRDDWDPIEENRMHTIIDPECFSRLIKACNAPSSEQQLEAPKFKMVTHNSDGDGSHVEIDEVPELTFAQTKTILDELERKSKRRSEIYAEYLSVEVDGAHSGGFDTAADKNFCLELNPASEQIQVFAADKEDKLLLASLWLSFTGVTQGEEWTSSIVLEGGQKLGIELKPSLNTDGELGAIVARISFQETNPLKILARYYQRIGSMVYEQLQSDLALNQIRIRQRALYTHRSGFAMLLLFAVLALSLAIPPDNNRLSQTSAGKRNERIDIVERSEVDLPPSPPMNPNAAGTRTEKAEQSSLYQAPWLDTKHLGHRRVGEPLVVVEQKREQGAPSRPESETMAANFNKPAKVENWPGWKFGGEQPVKFFDRIRDSRWSFSGHLETAVGITNRQTAESLQSRHLFFARLPFTYTDLGKSVDLAAKDGESFRQALKHYEAALAVMKAGAPASASGKIPHISGHFAFPAHRNDNRFVAATEKFSLARNMFLIGSSLPNAKQDNAVVQPDPPTQQLLSSILLARRKLWTLSSHDAFQAGQREKSTATKPPVAESLTGAPNRYRFGENRFRLVFDTDVLNIFHDHIDPSLMTGSRDNVTMIRTNGDNKNAFNISDAAEPKEATFKDADCVRSRNTSCAPSQVRFSFGLRF